MFGTTFEVVSDDQAEAYVPPGTDLTSRSTWSLPAIKYNESDFNAADWINTPIKDTHTGEQIGKVTSAMLNGDGLVKISATIEENSPDAEQAIDAFDAGKRLAFSVSYRSKVDLRTGRVKKKFAPDEVSICQEPHFKECLITIAANRQQSGTSKVEPYIKKTTQLTSKEHPRSSQYILMSTEQQQQAPPTTNATPQATQAPPATEASKAALEKVQTPEAKTDLEAAKQNSDHLAQLEAQRQKLMQENQAIAERLQRTEQEKADQAKLLAKFEKAEAQRIAAENQKKIDSISPFKKVLSEKLGQNYTEDNAAALDYLVTDPKHSEFIQAQADLTVKACAEADAAKKKLAAYEKQTDRLRQAAERGEVQLQASSLEALRPGNNTATPKDRAERKSNVDDLFNRIFSDQSRANALFTSGRSGERFYASAAHSLVTGQSNGTVQTRASEKKETTEEKKRDEKTAEPSVDEVHTKASGARTNPALERAFPFSIGRLGANFLNEIANTPLPSHGGPRISRVMNQGL